MCTILDWWRNAIVYLCMYILCCLFGGRKKYKFEILRVHSLDVPTKSQVINGQHYKGMFPRRCHEIPKCNTHLAVISFHHLLFPVHYHICSQLGCNLDNVETDVLSLSQQASSTIAGVLLLLPSKQLAAMMSDCITIMQVAPRRRRDPARCSSASQPVR